MMRRILAVISGVLIGLSVCAGAANAQPSPVPPAPADPGTSTSDELADMVMDVVEDGAAPATTPVPQP